MSDKDSTHPASLTLVCASCGATAPGATTRFRCECGVPLDLPAETFPIQHVTPQQLRFQFAGRLSAPPGDLSASGVWRYRELVLPLTGEHVVTRQEGNTPLYHVGAAERGGWRRIGEYAGIERLFLKHEGANPTGSFKDRGMTVGISVARALGARAVACASTGNTSASLAAYAAQAGLPALVFLPAGKVAGGKLAQTLAFGARLVEVDGDFDEAMCQVERVASELGIYLLNSINPYRLAGQRSIAYELLQQFDWQPPDWIVLPAGNLGNTSAIGAGLLHAHALGLIGRVPRIAAVQAAGANPFYRSFAASWQELQPVHAATRATAINIGAPVSVRRARAVVEATNGVVTEASDEDIFAAKAAIDRAGIGCEPASAAALAGAHRLVHEGVIAHDSSVVLILTGHLLKDPEQATGPQAEDTGGATPELDTLLHAVREAVKRSEHR
ncbi:MAG TPA: threonine synthase [Ktedonobacterales bacterium]|nr:threonine synthase [Ktedonobacterales bacterium]